MSNISSLEKLRKSTEGMIALTLAIVVFTISSLYWYNGFTKLSFVLFPQMAVFIILGFFHAHNIWSLENVISGQKESIFKLVCYTLLYSAWYNVVLLPESGLGYIEWVMVLLVMGSNIVTELGVKKINNPFMGQRPYVLVFLGVALFLIKEIFFFLFNDNIYDQMILQNGTARFFVFLFAAGGLVLLMMQLGKNFTNKLGVKVNKKAAEKSFKRIISFIADSVKKIFKMLVAAFSWPVIIIIVASVILVVVGLSFAFANKIYNDIMSFIEPLLEKIASTGENKIHPSIGFYACQTLSMATVLFYTVWIEKKINKAMKDTINERIWQTIADRKGGEDAKLQQEASQLLITSKFEDELRIFGSNTVIKETIENLDNEEE